MKNDNFCTRSLKYLSGISGELQFFLACISLILLPVYHWYLPPFMILWSLLLFVGLKGKLADFNSLPFDNRLLFLSFIIFFLWQLAGMLYSEHISEGIRNLTLRLPLLFFPLALVLPDRKVKERIKKLLRLFSTSTAAYMLICFGYALYRSVEISNGTVTFNPHPAEYPWLNFFYGPDLAIFQHPSYLSMYVILSVFIAFETLLDRSVSPPGKWIWISISLILLISVYLLSSRAALLVVLVTIPVYFIIKIRSGKLIRLYWVVALSGAAIVLMLFILNPRLQRLINSNSREELVNNTMKESRIGLWKAGLSLIRTNPVFGVGTGDIQSELNEEYNRMGNKDLLQVKDLNTHNQFIEITAENGFIGLIIFCAILVLMFKIAISGKNTLYFIFILVSMISFIFETMLNRLAGLSFFAIFSFLMLNIKNRSQSHE
jgi:O-antigen ligase